MSGLITINSFAMTQKAAGGLWLNPGVRSTPGCICETKTTLLLHEVVARQKLLRSAGSVRSLFWQAGLSSEQSFLIRQIERWTRIAGQGFSPGVFARVASEALGGEQATTVTICAPYRDLRD